jgi:hypothetical protein
MLSVLRENHALCVKITRAYSTKTLESTESEQSIGFLPLALIMPHTPSRIRRVLQEL